MKTQSTTSHRRGFTLIELLVVIAIIVILAGLSMGGFSYVTRKQAESQATIQISLLSKALEEYKLDNGTYPPTLTDNTSTNNSLYTLLYWTGASANPPGKIYLADLDPDVKKQGWISLPSTGNKAGAIIVDPWGGEYIYRRGDNADAKNPDFDLLSKGKDGETGTTATEVDDIDNY